MATRYGRRGPAEGGWALLEEALRESLEQQEGYVTTYEQRQEAVKDLKQPDKSSDSYGGYIVGLLAVGFPALIVISFIVPPETRKIVTNTGMIILILTLVVLGYKEKVAKRREKKIDKAHQKLEKSAETKLASTSGQLVSQAKRGDFTGFDIVPEAKPLAQGFYAEQQVGLELEMKLPDEVNISHDVDVVVEVKERTGSVGDHAIGHGMNALFSSGGGVGTSIGAAFLEAMTTEVKKKQVANIDHILTTAAGVIVVDTKHWTGTLSLDESGNFTAGPNHPGNQYRQESVETLAFLADQVIDGDVTFVLVIIDGGSVQDGVIETELNGHRIVAIERKDAVEFLRNVHSHGTFREVPPMKVINRNSPKLKF